MFFFTKIFRAFFHYVARGFFAGFSRFFSHIFSLYFSHGFSRRIFRTSLLRIFLTHFFIAVCCPKGFHSLQSQNCVTVPKTGHTTTCRSSPSLLTQYSHTQVEHFKSFWKDKRHIFTLQTIRHNIQGGAIRAMSRESAIRRFERGAAGRAVNRKVSRYKGYHAKICRQSPIDNSFGGLFPFSLSDDA